MATPPPYILGRTKIKQSSAEIHGPEPVMVFYEDDSVQSTKPLNFRIGLGQIFQICKDKYSIGIKSDQVFFG